MVLLEVIASLLWACLSGAPDVSHFNPVFSILISSIEIAEEYMQNAALTFAPGLLDAVESAMMEMGSVHLLQLWCINVE